MPIEQTWMKTLIRYMNGDFTLTGKNQLATGRQGLSWMYWCVSGGLTGSTDTGGIFLGDWKTIDPIKLSYISGSFSKTKLL